MNNYNNPQVNSQNLLGQTAIFSGLIAAGILFFVALFAVLGATLMGMAFASWGIVLTIGAGGLLFGGLIVKTYNANLWILTQGLANLFERQASEPAGQTVSAKGHARVIVNNAPAINQTQEVVRLVQVNAPGRLVEGVAEADLADFVDRVFIVGHSQRALMGYQLPSGKMIDTFETYDAHIQPLVKAGIITDRGERKKGRLTVGSADEAREILGLPEKV